MTRIALLWATVLCCLAFAPAMGQERATGAMQEIQEAFARREFARCEQLARARLADLLRASQPAALDSAEVIDLLAEVLRQKGGGALEEADRLARLGLAARQSRLSPDDPLIARSLRRLGQIATAASRYEEARDFHRRALTILERSPEASPRDICDTLTSLGIAERNLWELSLARGHLERAVAIQARLPHSEPLDVARRLINLANVRFDQGDLADARDMYEQVCEIYQRHLPRADPLMLRSLNNLANAEGRLGNCKRAIELEEKVLAVADSAGLVEWAWRPATLLSLAEDRLACGDPEAARDAIEESIRRLEGSDRARERITAKAWVTLGKIRLRTGDPIGAEHAMWQAAEIAKTAVTASDPLRVTPLQQIARARLQGGDLEGAEAMYARAGEVLASVAEPDLETVLDTDEIGAQIAHERGDPREARRRARRANEYGRRLFINLVRRLSEREALQAAARSQVGIGVLCRNLPGATVSEVTEAWDSVIRTRTRVLDELARRRNLSADPDSATRRLLVELREARSSAANGELQLAQAVSSEEIEAQRGLIELARSRAERLERTLAERSVRFGREREADAIGYSQVAESLPRGSALLAYVEVSALGDSDPARYGAFVLRPGGDPVYLDLGVAAVIEQAVATWRGEVAAPPSRPHAEADYRLAGTELRRLIFDPVRSLLPADGTVFVVPDGVLHQVNLVTLPDGDGYLVEGRHRFHVMASERSFARAPTGGTDGELLVIGDVDYERRARVPETGVAMREAAAPSAIHLERQAVHPCAPGERLRFPRLPGTADEAREVARTWRRAEEGNDVSTTRLDRLFLGPMASESQFRVAAPRAAVIHAATHGFLLDTDCARNAAGQVNPLSLSGLALAGANGWSDALDPTDDGLLSAEEVGTLDLSGSDWVVLSACDSGRGRVASGEGVLGLERAFEIAGARTVVASLWSVSDRATALWMGELYRARWEGRHPVDEAMALASINAIRLRRERGESSHPYYWGAFVAFGDWR